MTFDPNELAKMLEIADGNFSPNADTGLAYSTLPVFVISQNMRSSIGEICIEEVMSFVTKEVNEDGASEFFPKGARVPAAACLLYREHSEVGDQLCACCQVGDEVTVYNAQKTILFSFVPGSSIMKVGEAFAALLDDDNHREILAVMRFEVLVVSYILALINQPRFVVQSPSVSRQVKRRMAIGQQAVADAWHRISWRIGADVKAKVSRDPEIAKMPLHFRRGHHRASTPDNEKSYFLDGLSAGKKGPGWYIWIDEQWVGHPAFGIKKSYHAPIFKGLAA